jgi:hypothetical protein
MVCSVVSINASLLSLFLALTRAEAKPISEVRAHDSRGD